MSANGVAIRLKKLTSAHKIAVRTGLNRQVLPGWATPKYGLVTTRYSASLKRIQVRPVLYLAYVTGSSHGMTGTASECICELWSSGIRAVGTGHSRRTVDKPWASRRSGQHLGGS